ncbi:MAG: SDR family oxidoreductase [Acidimicrobiia bacterium]|nr:SDR family oxidoreductase [Acidimicrobiia bacterium]
MEIRDRVAVITGGASGIGAAMARRFKSEGARTVVVADLDGAKAAVLADDFGLVAAELDVADEEATARLLEEIESDHGPIDLLCLNAGIPTGGDLTTSNAEWERAWQVNVMAHVYAVRAVLPGMLARGDGYLLHTASAAGLLTNIGAAPYSVTKHAVVSLAEWLSVTYGDSGIKVSCLCPQFVDTPMLEVFEGEGQPGLSRFVQGLAISADDVASSVVTGIREERFLILPHPEVADYFQRKAADHDRWLAGMRKLQASFGQ